MMDGPFANIKAVFFDLDGTLKISTPNGVDAVLDYMSDFGIPISQETRRVGHRFAHEYWADRDRVEADMERLGPDNFWANYIRAKMLALNVLAPGQEPDENTVKEINRRFATEFSPRSDLEQGALALLSRLKERGFLVGLVSNRPLPLDNDADRLGIREYFDILLAAGEVDSWKPDAGIFLHALEMAGALAPEQALYIGDNYFADVLGAAGAGLKAVFIDPLHTFPEAEQVAFIISELADLLPYLNGN